MPRKLSRPKPLESLTTPGVKMAKLDHRPPLMGRLEIAVWGACVFLRLFRTRTWAWGTTAWWAKKRAPPMAPSVVDCAESNTANVKTNSTAIQIRCVAFKTCGFIYILSWLKTKRPLAGNWEKPGPQSIVMTTVNASSERAFQSPIMHNIHRLQ